ncbi:MAG: S-methyl-5-thioribose-1-phosphate isomerase [Fibrobacterales bacterium]
MKVFGQHYRTIWEKSELFIEIIDQTLLPHEFKIKSLRTPQDACDAISNMLVRGAGLIGATAGYGMYLACLDALPHENFDERVEGWANALKATRPTAVNLAMAVDRQLKAIEPFTQNREKVKEALHIAREIADEDAHFCESLGRHGVELIREISKKKQGETVNILTHCNAGWLAFVDFGSATAPIYKAFEEGIDLHVWVDETRPRNQGASLTAFELKHHGVKHTVIADNVGGHLMQHDLVDLVITGADRVTANGDVANKIGTYLKALAAEDNDIPFYVALPSTTLDLTMIDGVRNIPIEQRSGDEVKYIQGKTKSGSIERVLVTPEESPAANFGFDVTPARLITGLITERGICGADEESIRGMFGA